MRFACILADPPWRFLTWSARGGGRSPEQHYDTLTTADLCALPVAPIADKDAALFLWATMSKLPEALQVIEAWGFSYRTCAFTWAKTNPTASGFAVGLGYWTRSNPEVCLLGMRGHPRRISRSVRNLVVAPRGRHSAKPAEVRDRIVALLGDVPRVELFARETAPGWASLGNEIDGRDIRDALSEIAAN